MILVDTSETLAMQAYLKESMMKVYKNVEGVAAEETPRLENMYEILAVTRRLSRRVLYMHILSYSHSQNVKVDAPTKHSITGAARHSTISTIHDNTNKNDAP